MGKDSWSQTIGYRSRQKKCETELIKKNNVNIHGYQVNNNNKTFILNVSFIICLFYVSREIKWIKLKVVQVNFLVSTYKNFSLNP